MELEVQRFLRKGKSLEDLNKEFGINVCHHDTLPICILNYDQIDSFKLKTHPIVMECRALILEKETWNIIARSFKRFFNQGECPDLEKEFDFDNCEIQSKEDGSLIHLFNYKNQWHVTTRGSFGLGEISPGTYLSWRQFFFNTIKPVLPDFLDDLLQDKTYVFELCSLYNKNVREYKTPEVYLLNIINNYTGEESNKNYVRDIAGFIGCKVPLTYTFSSHECKKYADEHTDPTFEGYVLVEPKGRLKVKNLRFVALHKLKNNGNIFHPKNIIPLVLSNDYDEALINLPETSEAIYNWIEKLSGAREKMLAVWERAKGIESQKEFALYVIKYTSFNSILFQSRKLGREPLDIWKESEDLIVKKFTN